ncbi:hypothetical protein [Methylovulum sp.]|uniref:hypothetical protein n=1 Tax=Methylovulum sp. TaxID=1916980 RepID=UPI002613A302|nr:hypothetical protein [Methylovulum sp.]MDD5125029.1 hypothetical protein [Methylovulum sp.]
MTRDTLSRTKQNLTGKPKRRNEPNGATAKTKLQSYNGSPKQTKKLSVTTEADGDKPEPETYTPEA